MDRLQIAAAVVACGCDTAMAQAFRRALRACGILVKEPDTPARSDRARSRALKRARYTGMADCFRNDGGVWPDAGE